MIDIYSIFGVLSGIVTALGFYPYIRNILLGKTKPHRVTWFIFSILNVSALVSQIQAGAEWSLIFGFIGSLGCSIIFLLSIKKGYGKVDKTTGFQFAVALLALALSFTLNNPLLALSLTIFANLLGVWLTIRKSYLDPMSETQITWVLAALSNVLTLCAIENWTLAIALFPAYLLLSNLTIVSAVLLGKKRLALKTAQ